MFKNVKYYVIGLSIIIFTILITCTFINTVPCYRQLQKIVNSEYNEVSNDCKNKSANYAKICIENGHDVKIYTLFNENGGHVIVFVNGKYIDCTNGVISKNLDKFCSNNSMPNELNTKDMEEFIRLYSYKYNKE